MQTGRVRRRGLALLAVLLWLSPVALAGQQAQTAGARPLTLEEALRIGQAASEQVQIAQAGVQRARGEGYRARSERYPQLSGNVSYVRTLDSEFSAVTEDTVIASEPCPAFVPNPAATIPVRVDSLESALVCRDNENIFAGIFGNLPFGRVNQLNGGLSLSQTVFAGGRVKAGVKISEAGQRTAAIELASANAQLALDITRAYYDAALSDQLLTIAQATMMQAETTLVQVRLARQVGDQPEFELLRAQVTRDNQRPVVIQQQATRDLAHLRLKQLLNLPLDQSLSLSTPLESSDALPAVSVSATQADTSTAARAPVRQAAEGLNVQESSLKIARSQRWPNLTLASSYGRVAYPTAGFPGASEFRTNWTISAVAQFPIFTGFRVKGDVMVAEANMMEARARLQQVRELAALDTRDALEQLKAAEASWLASAGTVEQATRAHSIGEIRFREGISTQLELNDARILLQQARANRAVAARDLQVARMRVALLPDLPLGAGGSQMPVAQPQAPRNGTQMAPSQPAAPRSGGGTPAGRSVPVQATQVGFRPRSENK